MAKKTDEKETRKVSGRAQRRIAEEQARKRRIYWIIGAIVTVVLVVGVGYIVRERTRDEPLPEVVLGPPTEITAPTDGHVAGEPGAPVAVVEWGDYQ